MSEVYQKVTGVLKLDAYLAKFKDAQGRDGVRIVFKPEGSNHTYNLQEKIAGTLVATRASGWFERSFNDAIEPEKVVESI